MRKLYTISAVEDLPRFIWETEIQLNNLRKYQMSENFRLLIFLPAYKTEFDPEWENLNKRYPESKFFFYKDKKNIVTDLIVNYNYVPIHRICSLQHHFKEYPFLEKEAILYIDSDVIFTSQPLFEDYIQDDICYLSDTSTYLNAAYLEGKVSDVRPDKKDDFIAANPFEKIASLCKIDPSLIRANNNNTGGAQYLLKNVNSEFFDSCIDICLLFRMYYQTINQEYFPGDTQTDRENNGIQSWCADMIALQWSLWKRGYETSTPSWMKFAWATDETVVLNNCFILHNAGITDGNTLKVGDIVAPAFNKNLYKNSYPYNDIQFLESIVNNQTSQKYCTSVYAQEILNTIKNK